MTPETIASLIGYLIAPFAIAFCIVHFGLKKSYQKKHGVPMSVLGVIGRTVGIGIALLAIASFGAIR